MKRFLRIMLIIVSIVSVFIGLGYYSITSLKSGISVPSQGAVLSNVAVINPGIGRELNRTVIIAGDEFKEIKASGKEDTANLRGGYLLPGLIDMHVHMPQDMPGNQFELFSFLLVAHGVTTVRDMGSMDGSIFKQRDRIRKNEIIGPGIVASGVMIDGAPPVWPSSIVALNKKEGKEAVRRLHKMGAEFIKVYNNLPLEALKGVQEEAVKLGLKVVGHVPDTLTYQEAKLDDVQHFNGVPRKIARLDKKKSTIAERMNSWSMVNNKYMEEIVKVSKVNNIANTPTFVVLNKLGAMNRYDDLKKLPEYKLLPRYYRDLVWHPVDGAFKFGFTDATYRAIRDTQKNRKKLALKLHNANIPIFAGTDTQAIFVVPGLGMHQELRALASAGIPLEDIWAMATWKSARYMGKSQLGKITKGAKADCILFSEDPTKSIDALNSIKGVVINGRLFTKEVLNEGIQNYQEQINSPLYDFYSMLMVRIVLWLMF